MNPVVLGLSWYIPALVIFLIVSVKILDHDKRINYESLKKGLSEAPGNLIVLLLILLFIKLENKLQDISSFGIDFTPVFYNLEGNKHIVFLQSLIHSSIFTNFISIFYLLFFMGLLVAFPLYFILTGEKQLLRRYTYILAFSYAILVPSYLFFNVKVTSLYPENTPVKPLLYSNPVYLSLVMLVDRLDDCFPSGHISVPFSLLLLSFEMRHKRSFILTLKILILTAFAILFLGIHWGIDIIGGLLLGFLAYVFSKSRFTKPISVFIDKVNSKIERFINTQ
ncbi:MAG: phosphatase PAP2 family protein [Nanoarchaeota archaeon]|nr:phosphatase PAP2 family protein [Nanoarchaeota archaeon]